MSAVAESFRPMSIAEYLAAEERGSVRHEYINGVLHAMAGASERNNLIAVNVVSALHAHLRGGPCKAYMADFKVRLEINREDIFYYPDVMVACQRVGVERNFLRYPTLIVEVLSPTTEAIDRREKLLNYAQIPTMEEYALISQDTHEVTLHHRADNWMPRYLSGLESTANFRSVKLDLPLSSIYEGV